MKQFWGQLDVDVGRSVRSRLGDLRLDVSRKPEEVWVRGRHDDTPEGAEDGWDRWPIGPSQALELRPTLPDRPVVVFPEHPFYLPPRGRARIFVRVPLWARLTATGDPRGDTTLDELPSVVLSDTWWGSFTDGEVAYWVTTRARRSVTDAIFEPHLAICPFALSNDSDEALRVERFAVRVAHLTLFGRGDAVWTDEVSVRYEGAHEGSEIRYTQRVPKDAGDVELLAEPRESPPKGLRARTFGRLLGVA